MPKKVMLINVMHSEESRVGIVSEGVLESFEIESLSREHLKGNIYKGLVHRIHPALEAAFVDIGADRDAFLPLDEICFRTLPHPAPADEQGDGAENGRRKRRIRDVLRPGDEILAQITKEGFANKPPTLTTFYSLPGRYLVLLPGSDETGISRRIEGDERVRLRKLIADLEPPEGCGVIVRTAAGVSEDSGDLSRDLTYLQRLWENVQRAAQSARSPALVYREHDIVLRTIRDFFTSDIDEIYIDNEEVFQRAQEFLRTVMPGNQQVLHLYAGEQPIFSGFDVESQIESIFKRRVRLPAGGSIVIDTTEALTAIDVNSGGSVRGHNPEETAFRTNQQAATEIVRQLRLRDIGGLIVIDFIDMRDLRHIHSVEHLMRDAMEPDKARHEIGRISRFGLMEISRQRLRPAAMAMTYSTCPMCEGHGAVRTTESAALVALRKIHNRVVAGDVAALQVSLPSAVASYLLNHKREELTRLEERYSVPIKVNLDDGLMPHQVEIEARPLSVATRPQATVLPGAVASPDSAPTAETAQAAASAAPAEKTTGKKRRRRRGRRRGSGLRAAATIGDALASLGSPSSPSNGGDAVSPSPAVPEGPNRRAEVGSESSTTAPRPTAPRRRTRRAVSDAAPPPAPELLNQSTATEAGPSETADSVAAPHVTHDADDVVGNTHTGDQALAVNPESQPRKPQRRRSTTSRRRRKPSAPKSTKPPVAEASATATPQRTAAPRRRRTAAASTVEQVSGAKTDAAPKTRRRTTQRRRTPAPPQGTPSSGTE